MDLIEKQEALVGHHSAFYTEFSDAYVRHFPGISPSLDTAFTFKRVRTSNQVAPKFLSFRALTRHILLMLNGLHLMYVQRRLHSNRSIQSVVHRHIKTYMRRIQKLLPVQLINRYLLVEEPCRSNEESSHLQHYATDSKKGEVAYMDEIDLLLD